MYTLTIQEGIGHNCSYLYILEKNTGYTTPGLTRNKSFFTYCNLSNYSVTFIKLSRQTKVQKHAYATHFTAECERANSSANQKDSQSHEFNKNYKVTSNFTVKDKQS